MALQTELEQGYLTLESVMNLMENPGPALQAGDLTPNHPMTPLVFRVNQPRANLGISGRYSAANVYGFNRNNNSPFGDTDR